MNIRSLTLRNFRCFLEKELSLDAPVIILAGANGAGKTSVCEAIHYGCYARSFKTYTARELIAFKHDHSFLTISFEGSNGINTLSIGLAHQKKLIKLNDQMVTSAKTLLHAFPVVLVSEDDMRLIQAGPVERRSFVDQYLLLNDPGYIEVLRKLRVILAQRTALLQAPSKGSLDEWTKALWQCSRTIQERRQIAMETIITTAMQIVQTYIPDYSILASYKSMLSLDEPFDSFIAHHQELFFAEQRVRKNLFGAHLDDIVFTIDHTAARLYASRGQQKLIALLLKASIARLLSCQAGERPVLILDDIMSDFDEQKLSIALRILQSLDCQLIFTIAQNPLSLQKLLEPPASVVILLDNV